MVANKPLRDIFDKLEKHAYDSFTFNEPLSVRTGGHSSVPNFIDYHRVFVMQNDHGSYAVALGVPNRLYGGDVRVEIFAINVDGLERGLFGQIVGEGLKRDIALKREYSPLPSIHSLHLHRKTSGDFFNKKDRLGKEERKPSALRKLIHDFVNLAEEV